MLIKVRRRSDVKPSDITPKSVYLERRKFIGNVAMAAACAGITADLIARNLACAATKLKNAIKGPYSTDEKLTSHNDVTSYCNFYEFGSDKKSPARNAHTLETTPWSVTVEGACEKPGSYALEDIMHPQQLEERIYRLRCVEAWSMVIPWIGFPVRDVLKRFAPTSKAKYVKFETLYNPEMMPGQRRSVLEWPYTEALRIDEAMHPLTIFAVGLYGEVLPNQNGAPIRLVVPWKYGFKSIKSIVKIKFVENQPETSWSKLSPHEYGFYANVNPSIDHPRWSQKRERRIGEFLKRKTLMFNGYAEEVASLYDGMDLSKYY